MPTTGRNAAARKLIRASWRYRKLRLELIREAHGTPCPECKGLLDAEIRYPAPGACTIDHIIPIDLGGPPLARSNMQVLHFACNSSKSNRLAGEPPKPKRAGQRRKGIRIGNGKWIPADSVTAWLPDVDPSQYVTGETFHDHGEGWQICSGTRACRPINACRVNAGGGWDVIPCRTTRNGR